MKNWVVGTWREKNSEYQGYSQIEIKQDGTWSWSQYEYSMYAGGEYEIASSNGTWKCAEENIIRFIRDDGYTELGSCTSDFKSKTDTLMFNGIVYTRYNY